MLRFVLTFLFIVFGWGQLNAYAQEQIVEPDNVEAVSTAENQTPADTALKSEGVDKSQTKNISPTLIEKNEMSEHEVSTLSASDENGREANRWAKRQTWINGASLFLLLLTTIFAFGAWWVGRAGVKVTREIGIKQIQAYIDIPRIFLRFEVDEVNGVFWKKNENGIFISFRPEIHNKGQSPCLNVVTKANIKVFRKGETTEMDCVLSLNDSPNGLVEGVIQVNGDTSEGWGYCTETHSIESVDNNCVTDVGFIFSTNDLISISLESKFTTVFEQGFTFDQAFFWEMDKPPVLQGQYFEIPKRANISRLTEINNKKEKTTKKTS